MSFEAMSMMNGNTSWTYTNFQNYSNVTMGLETWAYDYWHDSNYDYRYACLVRMDYPVNITQSGWGQYSYDEYLIDDITSTPRNP